MHRGWKGPLLAVGWLSLALTLATAQPTRRPMQGKLKVDEVAPDFTIKDVEGKVTTKLSDLKGKPVVLIFGSCT